MKTAAFPFALLILAGWATCGVAQAPRPQPAAFERATALIMVDARDCGWCRKWEREVQAGYVASPEGRAAPLVKRDRRHPDLARFSGLAYTPTFILVSEGAEVGRIVGYAGADFFWGELARLWEKARFQPEQRAEAEVQETVR
jgi:hypothetical protein